MEGIKSMVPADFVIGPDLTVQVADYGNDIGDHLPVEKINLWLGSLQESQKPAFAGVNGKSEMPTGLITM
jgi:hypothetical protein